MFPCSRKHQRFIPTIETLEKRDCPAVPIAPLAPQLSLEVTQLTGRMVQLSGSVIDQNPATVTITFSGVMLGTTNPDAQGNFSFQAEASDLGTVMAVALDEENLSSDMVEGYVQSNAPEIFNFVAIYNDEGYWTFTGTVSDESPDGLGVQLGGLPTLVNKTASVFPDGSFILLLYLGEGEGGLATAKVTDWWGLESEVAFYYVTP